MEITNVFIGATTGWVVLLVVLATAMTFWAGANLIKDAIWERVRAVLIFGLAGAIVVYWIWSAVR